MRKLDHKFPSVALLLVVLLISSKCINNVAGREAEDDDYEDEFDGRTDNTEMNEEKKHNSAPLATDDNGIEITYESPKYDIANFYFIDHFDDTEMSQKLWVKSQAKKDDIAEEIAKYDGIWNWEAPQRIVWKDDVGLVLKSKAKHAAIAARLVKPFTFTENKHLVVQYEVTMQEGQECGGAYIKLLSADPESEDLTMFNDKTPYTIMFGPDKCGNDIKMHFIFRHVNPINGSITEKHCRKPKERLEEPFKDKLPHLYRLVVRPDNTYEISVDHKVINIGSLLTDFTPPVNPPSTIDDPQDKKPDDWDEREKITDPTAKKPDDWDDDAPPQVPDANAAMPDGWLEDEPEMIPDPSATIPEDWDFEMDGEWEAPLVDNPICEKAPGCGTWKAPLISNPNYKGKWRAPLIKNPNYRGKWTPRKIANPDFFEDLNPYKMTPIASVGIELWSMSNNILFDNLIITDDVNVALDYATQTFDVKRKYIEKKSDSVLNQTKAFFKESPWAWFVIAMIIVLPLTYYCFIYNNKKDGCADAKKTDAIQPDDISNADGGNGDKNSNSKKKKSDLEVKAADATETNAENEFPDDESDSKDKDLTESFEIEDGSEDKDGEESDVDAKKIGAIQPNDIRNDGGDGDSSKKKKSDVEAKAAGVIETDVLDDDTDDKDKESTESFEVGQGHKGGEEDTTKPRKRRVRKDES
ncbi:calnexin isoform X1 [Glossina fuscipes]|uniref:Calnexin isoform X1 n=1 Tax=Glossina fuscipes TaxID=7396 RepID=A0A8U0WG25_9MUSC|nr:calnexin isoform X1 [Glossina fuscipes]KAI9584994.1 hypothetical protein GQX74_006889 [Glossina fuscipes]